MEQITLKTTSNKVVKHDKTCCDNQHIFTLFVYDTHLIFKHQKQLTFLHIIQRFMHGNVIVYHKSKHITFKKIDFFLLKKDRVTTYYSSVFYLFVYKLYYIYI